MHKGRTILTLTHEPSWTVEPKETYRIIETAEGQFFGQYKKHKTALAPDAKVERVENEIAPDDFDDLLILMTQLHLPIYHDPVDVCDGSYFTLKLGNYFGNSRYRWFCGIDQDDAWAPLQDLAEQIIALAPSEPTPPTSCPSCGSTNIIPILYGEPTNKAIKQAEKGKIALGGCCQEIFAPDRKCKDCHTTWKMCSRHIAPPTRESRCFSLSFEFIGLPPDDFQPHRDISMPPDEIRNGGFLTMQRDQQGKWQMTSVMPILRWAKEQPIYQVEQRFRGYTLRRIPSGGIHLISLQAMRRIRGHARTVRPSEAYGLLIGWPENREVLAALPVGRTRTFQNRSDLFQDILYAMPKANELAAIRGLSVVGLYCTPDSQNDLQDISQHIPAGLEDLYLIITPNHSSFWPPEMLTRPTPRYGRLPAPWRISHRRIESAALNPRRIHSEWGKRFGPMDYGKSEVPEATDTKQEDKNRSRSTKDWFSAPRIPILPDELKPEWQDLQEAITQEAEISIIYNGGSTPGSERNIRPLELFRIEDYAPVYLQAIDTDIDEERIFRLDRILLNPP